MTTEKKILRDIIQWDVQNWSRAVVIWESVLGREKELLCLELGAGRGGLSLLAGLHGHHCICSDIADPAERAMQLHTEYNVSGRISYEQINALDIPYENHFDVVFLKSVLPSIGRNNRKELQRKAVNEAYKSLKKGGYLLFAENLAASALHQLARKKFVRWGSSVRYPEMNEMIEFLDPFSAVEFDLVGFSGAFGRTEKQREILGRVDALLSSLLPNRWKYLMVGFARK